MDSEKSNSHDEEKGKETQPIIPSGDDPSSKMWILSITHAEKHDADMVERWKDDMDGILIYTGVFSATVAAFLIESYKYLKPDPTDVSSRLLQQVTQELAGISNGDRFTPPTLDSFTPPRFAIHVNILWFSSLCVALACGLGATLVQQWVRRYLKLTRHSEMPTHRVRIRTFLFSGIRDFHVRLVVENISVLLHAAIFLFFAGLIEFLFAINHEVAKVVLGVVCFFGAFYIVLTGLPVIKQRCPFQTPLTSVIWYTTHFISLVFLSPFACSSHIRNRIHHLWEHTKEGFDKHIINAVKRDKNLDKEAVQMTFSMCRGDTDFEAFLEAVPAYLQNDEDIGTRINDIGSLLSSKGSDQSLGQRMVHVFSTCIHGDGKMDDVARRHRAITCSHVIVELSRAISSQGLELDLPTAIGHKLQLLSRDHDSKIAFAALKTIAILEHALLAQLLNAEGRMNTDRSAEVAEVLAAAIGETDSLSPRYQAGQRNNDRSDGRLIAVTEFTSSILGLTERSWEPSPKDIEDIKSTLKELSRDLNGSDFSPATQQRFVEVLSETLQAHLTFGSTSAGAQSSSETHHSAIIVSLQALASTLDARFRDLLKKHEFTTS